MYGLLNGNFIFDRWGRLYTGVCNCKHSELYCIVGQWGERGAYISFLRRPVEAADWIIIIKWDIVLEDNYLLCFCFTVLTDRIIGIDHRYRMIRQIDVFFFNKKLMIKTLNDIFFYQFTNHLFFKFALVLDFLYLFCCGFLVLQYSLCTFFFVFNSSSLHASLQKWKIYVLHIADANVANDDFQL